MGKLRFGCIACVGLLVLAACGREGQDEMSWARAALERNKALEIVAADQQSHTFTVRLKDSGELRAGCRRGGGCATPGAGEQAACRTRGCSGRAGRGADGYGNTRRAGGPSRNAECALGARADLGKSLGPGRCRSRPGPRSRARVQHYLGAICAGRRAA